MRFFSSAYHSLYDLAWLKEKKNQSGVAWAYFALLSLVLTLVTAIPLAASIVSFSGDLPTRVASAVPDFKAVFKGGALDVSGVPQPFIWKDVDSSFIVVVDTKASTSTLLSSYLSTAYPNGVLVAKDRMEFFDASRGEGRSQSWQTMPDNEFTKGQVMDIAKKLTGAGVLAIVVIAVFIGLFVGIFVTKLVSLLVVASLTTIVAQMAQTKWRLGELFTVGLYAVTLPSIIAIVSTLLGIQVAFIHSLALLAFMLAMVFTKEKVMPNEAE